MGIENIIGALDRQIGALKQAREILAGEKKPVQSHGKRYISLEGRANISKAQKARWAKRKRAA